MSALGKQLCGLHCQLSYIKSFSLSIGRHKLLSIAQRYYKNVLTTQAMEVEEVQQEPPLANPNANIVTERNANIISGGNVFYNPVQEFNRDLSIAALNVYFQRLVKERAEKAKKQQQRKQKQQVDDNGQQETPVTPVTPSYTAGTKYEDGMRILEALAATGLRSIRYAQEIAGVRQIVANDLSKQAVESIKTNVQHNGVEHLIETSHADAM